MSARALRPSSRWTGLVLAMAALAFGAPLPAFGAETVEERSTGVRFETSRPGEAGEELALTGVGVRKKFGLAKVYAFALYVEENAAREALALYAGHGADALAEKPAVYEALAGLPGTRLAVMHFVRDVDAEAIRDALDDALARGVPEDDPARQAFAALWSGTIADGEEVGLRMEADGTVRVLRAGAEIGAVTSSAVARALLMSWLGEDPVSKDIKEGVVARIPELLRAE